MLSYMTSCKLRSIDNLLELEVSIGRDSLEGNLF
jgi:hypothetical protein